MLTPDQCFIWKEKRRKKNTEKYVFGHRWSRQQLQRVAPILSTVKFNSTILRKKNERKSKLKIRYCTSNRMDVEHCVKGALSFSFLLNCEMVEYTSSPMNKYAFQCKETHTKHFILKCIRVMLFWIKSECVLLVLLCSAHVFFYCMWACVFKPSYVCR